MSNNRNFESIIRDNISCSHNNVNHIDPLRLEEEKKFFLNTLFKEYDEKQFNAMEGLLKEITVEELQFEINKISKYRSTPNESKDFTAFFCWAAYNNKTELFQSEGFRLLFKLYEGTGELSVIYAAIFNQQAFCIEALTFMREDKIRLKVLAKAVIYISIIAHNQDLLLKVDGFLKQAGIDVIELEKSLDVNYRFSVHADDLLFWAVRLGNQDAAEYLIKHKFNVNNADGALHSICSYLHIAARSNNVNMVRLLVKSGISIESIELFSKETILLELASCKLSKYDELIRVIVREFGANIYINDENGKSVLDYVTPEMKAELVSLNKAYKSEHGVIGKIVSGLSHIAMSMFSSTNIAAEPTADPKPNQGLMQLN